VKVDPNPEKKKSAKKNQMSDLNRLGIRTKEQAVGRETLTPERSQPVRENNPNPSRENKG